MHVGVPPPPTWGTPLADRLIRLSPGFGSTKGGVFPLQPLKWFDTPRGHIPPGSRPRDSNAPDPRPPLAPALETPRRRKAHAILSPQPWRTGTRERVVASGASENPCTTLSYNTESPRICVELTSKDQQPPFPQIILEAVFKAALLACCCCCCCLLLKYIAHP